MNEAMDGVIIISNLSVDKILPRSVKGTENSGQTDSVRFMF